VKYIGPSGKKAYKFQITDEDDAGEVEIPAAIFPAHIPHYLNDDILLHAGMHEGKVLKWRIEQGTKIPIKVKDAGLTHEKTTQCVPLCVTNNGTT